MTNKKNLIINCDVCDCRKIDVETLTGYESIVLNGDILLIDQRSKAALESLSVQCNVNEMVEMEGDAEFISWNGRYEINGKKGAPGKKALLSVNGYLEIAPGTEEILEQYVKIIVNGKLVCPESLSGYLSGMTVNGTIEMYPDDAVLLKSVIQPDEYFALRAREKRQYYARRAVVLTDPKVNVEELSEKGVRFLTKRLVAAKSMVKKAVALVDEKTELVVVPDECVYINDDAELSAEFLHRCGGCAYVDGNLTLQEESTDLLSRITYLYVDGTVRLLESQAEKFKELNVKYEKLEVIKGTVIKNKVTVKADNALLDASRGGISVMNCARVEIAPDLEGDRILKEMMLQNCAKVVCAPSQRAAVELICKNVAEIKDGTEEDGEEEKFGLGGLGRLMKDTRVVNADMYIL